MTDDGDARGRVLRMGEEVLHSFEMVAACGGSGRRERELADALRAVLVIARRAEVLLDEAVVRSDFEMAMLQGATNAEIRRFLASCGSDAGDRSGGTGKEGTI